MREMSCGDRWQRRRGRGILTLVAATALLLGAGVQLLGIETAGATTTSFTWTGSSTSLTWSSTANWSGTVAPTSSSSVTALTFPTLGVCSSHACYDGDNDLTGLSTKSLSIRSSNDGTYYLHGNAIIVGTSGLRAVGGTKLALPIVLGASQTWTEQGVETQTHSRSLNLEIATVTGTTKALTLQLTTPTGTGGNSVFIGGTQGGNVEVGTVSIVGDGITSSSVAVASLSTSQTASLNYTTGKKVFATDVSLVAGGPGTNGLGPVSASHAFLQIGESAPTPGIVHVNGGVTLAQTSRLSLMVGSTGTTAGTDYGQLHTTGNVDLTSTSLAVGDISCYLANDAGATLTLVTAGTAHVTGAFTGLPTGGIVSVEAGSTSCNVGVKIHYSTHQVTGTVVVGAPTAITQSTITTSATRGTLAGSVFPRGSSTTYKFEYGTTTGYGTDVPVTPVTIGSNTTLQASYRSLSVTTLTPSTTYHYQIVATNSMGTVYGGDKTFTTTASALPVFTADSPPTPAAAGSTYSYTFAATHVPTYAFTGSAPTFLSITYSSGVV